MNSAKQLEYFTQHPATYNSFSPECTSHLTQRYSPRPIHHNFNTNREQNDQQSSSYKIQKHKFVYNPSQKDLPLHKFVINSTQIEQQPRLPPTFNRLLIDNYPTFEQKQLGYNYNQKIRKNTSSDSTVSDKAQTYANPSPQMFISPPLTARNNQGLTNLTSSPKDQFKTIDRQSNPVRQNEIIDFRQELNGKLKQIKFYIEKAEEAQSNRRSNSNGFRRRQTASPLKRPLQTMDSNLDYQETRCRVYQTQEKKNDAVSKQSSYASINFNLPTQEQRTAMREQNNIVQNDRIDTIEENDVDQSDNEEETRIVQMLSSNHNNSSHKKINQRYQNEQINPSIVSEDRIIAVPYVQVQNNEQALRSKKQSVQSNANLHDSLHSPEPFNVHEQLQYTQLLNQINQYKQKLNSMEIQFAEMKKQNAEYYNDNRKLNHKVKSLSKKLVNNKCKQKMIESQYAQQKDLFNIQNQRIELVNSERFKLIDTVKVQEDQIRNLKMMLNQNVQTKIKYENIFKKLLDDPNCREYVLNLLKV